PEDAVALAADPEVLLDHADGMHGIEVREHQDALALLDAPVIGRLALEDVAEAVTPRDAFELQPEIAELALDMVDHLVDRAGIVARAFDRHPLHDAVQDLVGIDLRLILAGYC